MLGFEPMAGDMMPLDAPAPSPAAKHKKVAAAAKARRRERRGERRSRGSGPTGGKAKQAVNKLAIFDCDGTLVDSGATIHAALG